MEREPSLKSPDLAAIFGKPKEFVEGKAEETYEEDHSLIPGQIGTVEVNVGTLLNRDRTISEVRIDRRNSLVPSTLTNYEMEGGKVVAMRNFIYTQDMPMPELVETVDELGETTVFPDGEVKKLVGMFIDPVPEKISDLTLAIEKAKEVKHPAVQIIKEGDKEVALVTRFSTHIDHKANYQNISLSVTLYRFRRIGERLVVESRTKFNLRGLYHREMDPTITRVEYLYDHEELIGRKYFVQGELIYTDTFVPRPMMTDGKEIQVFDFERVFGEWARKEKGRDKEVWKADIKADGTKSYKLEP